MIIFRLILYPCIIFIYVTPALPHANEAKNLLNITMKYHNLVQICFIWNVVMTFISNSKFVQVRGQDVASCVPYFLQLLDL